MVQVVVNADDVVKAEVGEDFIPFVGANIWNHAVWAGVFDFFYLRNPGSAADAVAFFSFVGDGDYYFCDGELLGRHFGSL